MPLVDEIKITIFKPSPLNINSKLVIITQFVTKSKKLPNPLIFNRN